ncbi:MAG: molybdopterin-dependent oxidoreductase [Actinobacteria bacterium]|nr:molybdopterin-dependent oxidoreductase [Actinomycetota bacterium]
MDRPGESTDPTEPKAEAPRSGPRAVSRGNGILAGIGAAVVALAASEVVAGLSRAAPSLLLGVGDAVIDATPGWLDRAAIDRLGHSDKSALIIGIACISLIAGAALGNLARKHLIAAASGFIAFAVCGVVATATRPDNSVLGAVIVGAIGAAAGIIALRSLLGVATRQSHGAPAEISQSRRRFLVSAGGTLVIGVLAGVGGWILSGRERIDDIRRTIRLPRPFRSAAPVPAGADLHIDGLSPVHVPNSGFYRVDTALQTPAIDPDLWRLEVRGLVDRPFSLTYEELMALPQIEADVTLACVSNDVGGNLVGNARWQGVPLRGLLERAGVQPAGVQVVGHSVDGFTAGFPAKLATRIDNAMVAVGMNGVPLPVEHGFPARLLVPGLYGYVSATKWLSAIELAGWDVDGYWIPRGWSKNGPIKTQSRIDVPADGATVRAGHIAIAGVAWAPTRGIEKVEVSIDSGPWQTATLADSLGEDSWRQWHLAWDASPGTHTVSARATDGTGVTQTATVTPPAPDGATGYPSIQITVRR